MSTHPSPDRNPPDLMPQRVYISDEAPLDTAALREHPVFTTADPDAEVPDVVLGSAPPNPRDRLHRGETRVGIYYEGERVGAVNLAQTADHTWMRDTTIEKAHQNKRLAVAAYLGVMAASHDLGRTMRSDPAGLNNQSRRIWESLTRRGVAQPVPGERDQHGNPAFVSKPPQSTL